MFDLKKLNYQLSTPKIHHINLTPEANILLLANSRGLAIFQLQLKILKTSSLRLVFGIENSFFFLVKTYLFFYVKKRQN
jgi:hypothetical protein